MKKFKSFFILVFTIILSIFAASCSSRNEKELLSDVFKIVDGAKIRLDKIESEIDSARKKYDAAEFTRLNEEAFNIRMKAMDEVNKILGSKEKEINIPFRQEGNKENYLVKKIKVLKILWNKSKNPNLIIEALIEAKSKLIDYEVGEWQITDTNGKPIIKTKFFLPERQVGLGAGSEAYVYANPVLSKVRKLGAIIVQ